MVFTHLQEDIRQVAMKPAWDRLNRSKEHGKTLGCLSVTAAAAGNRDPCINGWRWHEADNSVPFYDLCGYFHELEDPSYATYCWKSQMSLAWRQNVASKPRPAGLCKGQAQFQDFGLRG